MVTLTKVQMREARRISASIAGKAKSQAKSEAARANGKLGGRPRKNRLTIKPTIIITEANFLNELLHKLYIGVEEFTAVNWRTINNRLQAIRNEARR